MSERVVGVVPTLKKGKSFGRWDTYTMVVTDTRSVFALMTSAMIQQIGKEAVQRAKDEGKGFFARWGEQLKAHIGFSQRYLDMTPEDTLNENKNNFFLNNDDIRTIKVRRKTKSRGGEDDVDYIVTEFTIEARGKKYQYEMDSWNGEVHEMLKSVFGSRVDIGR